MTRPADMDADTGPDTGPDTGTATGAATGATSAPRISLRPLLGATALLAAEVLVLSLIYKHAIAFTCRAQWSDRLCDVSSGAMVALLGMFATLSLFVMLVPQALRDLLAGGPGGTQRRPALILNLAGFAVALIPLSFMGQDAGIGSAAPAIGLWACGMGAMLAGFALMLAPLPAWTRLFAAHGTRLLPVILAGLAAPALATLIRPLWRIEAVASVTFKAVSALIQMMGFDVWTDTARQIIGTDAFAIDIAPVCSGIEGIALVTIFVTLYLGLFRAELRFPRALWLYPAGILVSFLLNIVRITVLLVIGLRGHPELAVGGFHSHAGWLMFTLVALGVIAVARSLPALQKRTGTASAAAVAGTVASPAPLPPLRRDPAAARLLPFAVFMLSALFAATFAQTPGVVYPLRALAMAAALALFWPLIAPLLCRPSPAALGLGLAVGALWVLVPVPAATGAGPQGGLSGSTLVLWYVARGIGTVLLVPIIEELFFRDYLESRLRQGLTSLTAALAAPAAALVTAGLFAALHDRWAEALVAGLAFSLAMRLRGRVGDAIAAHALANAVVFAAALATGRLEIL